MSTFRDAVKRIGVFVDNMMRNDSISEDQNHAITASMSGIIRHGWYSVGVIAFLLVLGCTGSHARVSSPGNVTFSSPNSLNTSAIFDSTGTYVLQLLANDGSKSTTATVTVVVNSSVVMPKLVGGSGSGISGNAWEIPISFTAGTLPVTGLQFDLQLPQGLTVSSATVGPAGLAAAKSIASNLVGSNYRIILFGLNQTTIGSGVIASVLIRTDPAIPTSSAPIPIINMVASDASGNGVPMGASGNMTVNFTANGAPVVSLGPNQTITTNMATLTGTASDDGAPSPSKLTFQWSVL